MRRGRCTSSADSKKGSELARPARVRVRRWVQPVRREHRPTRLVAHEREEVDPSRVDARGLLARDLVEALDRARDRRRTAERRAGRRERPVRLRERDDAGARRARADRIVDDPELCSVTILARSAHDVVRPDQQRDERGPEMRERWELVADELVRRVAVHRRILEDDLAPRVAPESLQHRGERPVGRCACPDRERVTEGKNAFWNRQVF